MYFKYVYNQMYSDSVANDLLKHVVSDLIQVSQY